MTRSRRLLALGSMVASAAVALGVGASSVSARGGIATAGYTLNAYGTLNPMTIGGTTAPSETAASAASHSWPGWNIARGMAEAQNHTDGLVLDGWGGLHGWGTNTSNNAAPADPTNNAYWKGWDIARAVVLIAGSNNSGYVLDGWGGVHPFGSAPAVTTSAYYQRQDIARSIELNPAGTNGCTQSGFVMDAFGGVHPFDTGDCTTPIGPVTTSATWPGWAIARSIVIDNDNKTANKGYVMDGWGGLHPWCAGTGCALPAAVTTGPYWHGWDIARSAVSLGTGTGLILDGWGGVHGYGGAASPGTTGYAPGSDIFKDLDEN